MVRIVLDAELRAKLQSIDDSAEIVDQRGELFAVVTRINGWRTLIEPALEAHERPPFGNRKTFTSEEIAAELRAR